MGIIGASMSEPHIDRFAVNFVYLYCTSCHNHFLLVYFVVLRHMLIQTTNDSPLQRRRLGAGDCPDDRHER